MTFINERNWHHAKLKNGQAVRIRPIQETDAPYMINIFDHLSTESRYMRFNQSLDHISQADKIREALKIAYDGSHHGHGWLAFADLPQQQNAPVGGVRYFQTSSTTGELAITIRDDFHGHGLGGQLLALLIEQARSAGLQKITGMAQHNNHGLWHLLKQTNLPLNRYYDGPDSYFELTL